MSKQSVQGHTSGIERALETLFTAPIPDPTFVSTLERQLQAHNDMLLNSNAVKEVPAQRLWSRVTNVLTRHRWATVTVSLLLALTLALAVTGPQRVWADLQRFLGYVPGVGFVNLEETRVLVAPVEVSRDAVTLRVEQILAQSDRTVVVIRSEGLPPENRLWPDGAKGTGDYQPWLRLPDGSKLASNTWTLHLGGGTL